MKATRFVVFLLLIQLPGESTAQFLSNLQAVKTDALFTTYAAPIARSNYKNDQGYQFLWTDEESGAEFISKDGPNTGIAFQFGNRMIFKTGRLYKEPMVTTSYSDLVRYFYYPVKDLRVEVFFAVYTSEIAIVQYRFANEGHTVLTFGALPYLYYPSADSIPDIYHQAAPEGYSFTLQKKRDGWMVEHTIPLEETIQGSWLTTGCPNMSCVAFVRSAVTVGTSFAGEDFPELVSSMLRNKRGSKYIKGMIRRREFTLQPGDVTSFRMEIRLTRSGSGKAADVDLEKLVKEDEQAYAKIPQLKNLDKDREMLYWSSFSLMRQCMMPPEGECKRNYYVFSREPKWGWGYGGQVFHESLAMMAYAYMDPTGAMNSQRIFMDRQQPDGYINYRTGPYLNETIETNGKKTSSAPWFNYENLEIYRVTGDRRFLQEAYNSGKKFYQHYVARRDSNNNGLCEWGAHAELESVRDARVAVWDNVGWASNFEGPDVNSMLVMEAKSLAEMAKQMGLAAESRQWLDDANRRSVLINSAMWDPVSKFYYNVTREGQSFSHHVPDDLKIKEIIGFLPLWAGVADSARAKELVAKMMDTLEFWRPYGIPSLSAAHAYYCPIGYWNGPVWVQWEYLLYRGLRENGYKPVADELARHVLDNMIYHLKKDHVFWEFYSADDRQAGWNKTYIWAGIAALFLIH